MEIERLQLLDTATRRARRAKRTSGRLFVSAFGFGLAYYFDVQNGSARRQRLHGQLRRAIARIDAVFAPDSVSDDLPPVFYPLMRSLPQHPAMRTQQESKTG